MTTERFDTSQLSGRNRRLLNEWKQLEQHLTGRSDLSWRVSKTNPQGLPTGYRVDYHIRSICGVSQADRLGQPGVENRPLFADHFVLQIDLPANFPQVDAPPIFQFLTADEQGQPIPHPWHPNISFFGSFGGRVCLNRADTFTSIAWGVSRVAAYLRYEVFHALMEPPYPEDLKVAEWVRTQGEPNGWTVF